MLKPTLLAAALALCATPAFAHHHHEVCNVSSPYDVKLTAESLTFTREGATPHDVRMAAGRLTVDGREIALTAADRASIARYEAEVRALVPEVKQIAKEAIGIAFGAILHVAQTFADSDADFSRSRDKLEDARRELEHRIDTEFDSKPWNDVAFERVIGDAVKATVPVIVGDITAKAIKVALSGDEKAAEELERKAEKMEQTLEREVERKADALEARANALCPRIVALDRIESELALRLPDNAQLDLLHAR
jgi:hypothetical protein